MKLRNNILPVVCILVAMASLGTGSPVVAQEEFLAPPFMPPVRQFYGDRFYVQAGAQYRNLQRFSFQKSPTPSSLTVSAGEIPFGPTVSGPFGSGTGINGLPSTAAVPEGQNCGYPINPTGLPATPPNLPFSHPNLSGVWIYDNGWISPGGTDQPGSAWYDYSFDPPVYHSLLYHTDNTALPGPPGDPRPSPSNQYYRWPGLGSYQGASGEENNNPYNLGIFRVSDPPAQVGNGWNGSNFPNFDETYKVTWERALRDPADPTNPLNPANSEILVTYGFGISDAMEDSRKIWTPAIEFGYRWSNYIDLLAGFSWYDLKGSMTRTSNLTVETHRRVIKDTFGFWSDADEGWALGPWQSNYVRVGNENRYHWVMTDTPFRGQRPSREFLNRQDQAIALRNGTETIVAATDLDIYEAKAGARSWTPMFGLGRFGVTCGVLANFINFRASATRTTDFTDLINDPGRVFAPIIVATKNIGYASSFGVFAGADVEVVYNRFFVRGNAQYNLVEEKQFHNAADTWTNVSLTGFTSTLATGVRF